MAVLMVALMLPASAWAQHRIYIPPRVYTPPKVSAPPKTNTPQPIDTRTIVVQVIYRPGAAPAYKINENDVAKRELQQRLVDIYANRAERVMFVKGDDNVDFRFVAEVIDIGKAANVDHIGLMTPKIMAGQ